MLPDSTAGQEYRCPTCENVSLVGASADPPPPGQAPEVTQYQQVPENGAAQAPPPQAPPPQYNQQPPPGAPPVYPGQQPAPGAPPVYGQPQYGQPQQYQGPRENAPGAVAALVCGILSFFCCGLIFGIIAIFQANKAKEAIAMNPGYYGGEGMATAGKVLGIIGLIVTVLVLLAQLAQFAVISSS